VVARLVQRIAYVPEAPGRYRIPDRTVNWFDPAGAAARQSTLPGRELEVAAAAVSPVTEARGEPAPAETGTTATGVRLWQGAFLLVTALWGLTAWGWWRSRQQHASASPPSRASGNQDRQALRRTFLDRARENDPQAPAALAAWARAEGLPGTLAGLATACASSAPEFAEALRQRDRQRYSAHGSAVDWRALAELAPERLRPAPPAPQTEAGLPSLYPTRA